MSEQEHPVKALAADVENYIEVATDYLVDYCECPDDKVHLSEEERCAICRVELPLWEDLKAIYALLDAGKLAEQAECEPCKRGGFVEEYCPECDGTGAIWSPIR